ncbi:MAG: ATP-binding cassette domain-containing protein [Candidatus Hydrogenedentota bacterium]|nr:MAG: ATP-binding cassette domain-containing protein [Candidatus Hydrogenedentota bacterium]
MIEAKNLTMRYGPTVAVDDLSFKVSEGEVLGLLGPNGAGKTTLMRILTTFIVPAEGTATIGGHDIKENPLEVRRLIGYLPETVPLYPEMRVDEYLRFIARARGLDGDRASERISWVIEAVALQKVLKNNLSELSRGYCQRVGLAQALVHDPEVLILDEPTSTLDPLQIIEIRELIRRLAREKTIIFSTHIMQEASAISDRILIINMGKKIADGTIAELEEQAMKTDRFRLTVKASRDDVQEGLRGLRSAIDISFIDENDGFVTFEIRSKFGTELWSEVDRLVKARGWPLQSFAAHRISLEDTFLELTRASQKAVRVAETPGEGGEQP